MSKLAGAPHPAALRISVPEAALLPGAAPSGLLREALDQRGGKTLGVELERGFGEQTHHFPMTGGGVLACAALREATEARGRNRFACARTTGGQVSKTEGGEIGNARMADAQDMAESVGMAVAEGCGIRRGTHAEAVAYHHNRSFIGSHRFSLPPTPRCGRARLPLGEPFNLELPPEVRHLTLVCIVEFTITHLKLIITRGREWAHGEARHHLPIADGPQRAWPWEVLRQTSEGPLRLLDKAVSSMRDPCPTHGDAVPRAPGSGRP